MKRVRLKDLIELKTETISPKKNDNYFLYSLPSFDNNKNREYLKGGKIQSNKYKVPNRSILFNKLNVRFKRVWKIDNTDNNKICSTEFLPLVVDENKAYYNFCYYLLISENITNFLCNQNANTSGSHKRIDASMLLELEINLPPLETQQKIAKILSDIDDKIEILHQINDNLAELAKTIYDYWFVQFDFPDENGKPYKSNGGKMVYNEVLKREIPEGWEVKNLYEIADYINGLACQKYRPTNENNFLPVIKIKEMNEGISSNTEKVRTDIPEKYIIYDGDVLFSWSASLDVKIWVGGKGGLNQHIFKVKSNKFPMSFYFFELKNYLQHFKMMAELRKTTMGHITINHLKDSYISIPTIVLIEKLDIQLRGIIENIVSSKKQIQHLQSLRYWLLPMLMNGQVSVE